MRSKERRAVDRYLALMSVIERFYAAFAQRDWSTMGKCYAEDARFSDPVFPELSAPEVRAMWKMLLTSGSDLRVRSSWKQDGARGVGRCEASYTFSRTGRKVHNVIRSEFELRDGLIVSQRDRFGFWRWSGQALGASGWLLGWSPVVRNKMRAMAASGLRKALTAG
jgi:ketosteroid isomerase-like protein